METSDFSARCQGIGLEGQQKGKGGRVCSDPNVDTYMKGVAINGLKKTLQTDYILRILGQDVHADRLVEDAMRRVISGGQKKKLTTGEMIVGPNRALFLDVITNMA
ncbi:hypothetical protein CDL15_Pgr006737 [Punica granatum]|uniref:Uncharacterized protein n=1 Tax=Punica granatum TaxID=22663 RepID=A0A218X6Y1_PUNGR|nr:hypothetical protein CDL15_Pgr006737 [Punica granatum]